MDELDLIRSFRADVPAPSAAATARAEHAWRRAPSRRRRLTAPRLPRLAAAGALAAAAIAAAVALPGGDGGGVGPAEASAADALRQAADAQSGMPARPLRAGEFWYVRTRSASIIGGDEAGGYTAIQPQVREGWVAADGSRRQLVRPAGRLRFPGPRDRARWEAAGKPQLTPDDTEEHRFRPQRHGAFYLGDAPM